MAEKIHVGHILDIPPWWGEDEKDFKNKIIKLIQESFTKTPIQSPLYRIKNRDGSTTPFYPIFYATSPECGVITKEEIRALLDATLVERAQAAYLSATHEPADHILLTEYLAWGLEQKIYSDIQLKMIRFDYGNTPESYIKTFKNPQLTEEIIDTLIHPRSEIDFIMNSTSQDVSDCCLCHH